jgi:hypothetical protein
MKEIISKILNRTDLGESGSHGGLVIPKKWKVPLKNFFGNDEVRFYDKKNDKFYKIQYKEYTLNKTTPNDRISPIDAFANANKLEPGDVLTFIKEEDENFYIDYYKRMCSWFFLGRSDSEVDGINSGNRVKIIKKCIEKKEIEKNGNSGYVMKAKYRGNTGILRLDFSENKDDSFSMYFDNASISENNKYYELDLSTSPFALYKTESWSINIVSDESDEESLADIKLVEEVNDLFDLIEVREEGAVIPMPKMPRIRIGSKNVAARERKNALIALEKANNLCEINNEHESFIRKNTHVKYMEPHHLIPLKYDELFEFSLDVPANIVSLCSNCHNEIHYGEDAELLLRNLWEKRKDILDRAGLCVMRDGTRVNEEIFLGFYNIKH